MWIILSTVPEKTKTRWIGEGEAPNHEAVGPFSNREEAEKAAPTIFTVEGMEHVQFVQLFGPTEA